MLGAVAESVVGATVIRAYGVSRRTEKRLDASIESLRQAEQKQLKLVEATETRLLAQLETRHLAESEAQRHHAHRAVVGVPCDPGTDG